MTKNVKITVNGLPITSISTPLTMGTHGPVRLDEKDIFKCIIAGAKVVEVFDGYGEVVLTLSNYNKDNTPYMKAAVVKTVMDEMEKETPSEVASADCVHEYDGQSEQQLESTSETLSLDEADESEEHTEEVTENEEPKSPEHWMPPQRDNNGQKNNNNRNKGKRR